MTNSFFSDKIFQKNAHEIYIAMNKPVGYVCSAVSDSHKTVYELLSPQLQQFVSTPKRGHKLHTIGRLDCDTSGLLLFTTDGFFSHKLTSPESKTEKTYIVTLKNRGDKTFIQKASQGLVLPAEKKSPEQKCLPVVLSPLDETLFKWEVKITEGKFHQVRRIFSALGNEVESLQRIKIGSFLLPKNLKPGDYCFFNPQIL